MKDSPERDLAVANELGRMADARIKELEDENAALRVTLIAVKNCQNVKCGHCAALLRATVKE